MRGVFSRVNCGCGFMSEWGFLLNAGLAVCARRHRSVMRASCHSETRINAESALEWTVNLEKICHSETRERPGAGCAGGRKSTSEIVILSGAKNPVVRQQNPAVCAHWILHFVQNDKQG